MANIRILGAAEVRQALPMAEAIQGMKEAYAQLSAGKATLPLRSRFDLPNDNGTSLFMPAYISQSDDLADINATVYREDVSGGEPVLCAARLVLDAPISRIALGNAFAADLGTVVPL